VPNPLRPRALRPGARIHLAAPSGPVPADRLEAGILALRAALGPLAGEFTLAPNLAARDGYFAGDDDTRLAALATALADPEIDAIVCARGGYGLTRLLPRLDPARFTPKLLVGALVAECGAVLRGGSVEGPLIAANLEVLRTLIGTRFMPDLTGCILALEEVGERPYRIDRALTQLLTSGALRGIRGVAVGQLHLCEEPPTGNPDSPDAEAVVLERLATLGVPVVTGFPFGHKLTRNAALPFASQVRLDADNAALYCLEPVAL